MKIDCSEATIMIIDDEPENLNVLESLLTLVGYRVSAFRSGEMALAALRYELPDLILLDIRMPGMDGYEVCRRFKADERLCDIPVIFLSAQSRITEKVQAFEVGGVDYVLKPFAEVEVLARVGTHLRLRRHQLHLEELVERRVRELAEAHRRLHIWDDAKSQWLSVLSHEMRTPLNGLIGITELLFMDLPPESEQHAMRTDYDESLLRIEKLMDDALTLARIDVEAADFAASSLRLAQVLRIALDMNGGLVGGSKVQAVLTAVENVTVVGDLELLNRAFTDLLLTASQCVETGQLITLETCVSAGQAHIAIITHGQPLSDEAISTFFEVGGQRMLLKCGGDFGLGAALASRIIRLFKGHVSVRNGAERGVVVEISFPIDGAQSPASTSTTEFSS